MQASVAVRNARLDADETTIGTAPLLRLYTGSAPANCAAAATGTLLCEMTLPTDYMAAASGGSKALSGTWSDTGVAAGDAGYWRVYDSAGSTCHLQGACSATGGGGELALNNISIAIGQTVTVLTFTVTAGDA